MATDKYTQFMEDAKTSGEIPQHWIERIESTYEASGLRNDYKSERERAIALEEKLSNLRDGLLTDRFKSMGITASPKAFRIPDDLDPSDTEKLESWATEMGLIQRQETTPPADRAVHDRIASASTDGPSPTVSLDDLDPTKLSEDEFYAKAEALSKARRQ
jgi:hypothetical protein